MTEDPYEILGVSKNASEEEIKKAYRRKARENHPDLNPDDPQAAERMNKVNEAYDRITNPEKYTREDARRRGYGAPYAPGYGNPYGGGYGTPGGAGQNPYGSGPQYVYVNWEDIFGGAQAAPQVIHPEVSAVDSAEVRSAISYINNRNYRTAVSILDNIPARERTARWFYLSAIANHGAGNSAAALERIRRARKMDPQNSDYQQAERARERTARWFYLSAIANHGAGNSAAALERIRRARKMDPQNSDYQQAERAFARPGQAYQQQGESRGGAGNSAAALERIRRARKMDPQNSDYQQAERAFARPGQAYQQQGESRGFSITGIDPTTLCCCLLCAPSLCQPFLFCL